MEGTICPKFRFMDLQIWKDAIEIANELFDVADLVSGRRYYRIAEQLRASALSMSNNIAEGSGSESRKDFANFLNFARRSAFENANVLLLLHMRGLLHEEAVGGMLAKLDLLCRKITKFQRSLRA